MTEAKEKQANAEKKIKSIEDEIPKLRLELNAAKCQTQTKCTDDYTGEDKETLCKDYSALNCKEILKNLEVRNDIEEARKTIASMETSIGNIEKQLLDYNASIKDASEKKGVAEATIENNKLVIDYSKCMAAKYCKAYNAEEGKDPICNVTYELPTDCDEVIKKYQNKFGKKVETTSEEKKVDESNNDNNVTDAKLEEQKTDNNVPDTKLEEQKKLEEQENDNNAKENDEQQMEVTEATCKCGATDQVTSDKCTEFCEEVQTQKCKCGETDQVKSDECTAFCKEVQTKKCKCEETDQVKSEACNEICNQTSDSQPAETQLVDKQEK